MNNQILDQIIEYLPYAKQYERSIWARCIFHDDNSPSLVIYPDRYYCKSCEEQGWTIQLLRELSNNEYVYRPNVQPDFHNPFTPWLSKDPLEIVLESARYLLKRNSSLRSYLKKRCIPTNIQDKLGIGYRDGWYLFPIKDKRKRLLGAFGRIGEGTKSAAKYVIPSGQDPNLLYIPSWKLLERSERVFLTFGSMDTISLTLMGYASISTSTGKRINTETLDNIRKPIWFWPDKGEEKETYAQASKLGWRGNVIKCDWPNEYKDVNDLFISNKSLITKTIEANNALVRSI